MAPNGVSLKRKLLSDKDSENAGPDSKKASVSIHSAYLTKRSSSSKLLCARCRAIDIDAILSLKFPKFSEGRAVADLKGDPRDWEKSQCPLCNTFAAMRPSLSREEKNENLVLYALAPYHRLSTGMNDENVLLAVVRKDTTNGRDADYRLSHSVNASGVLSSIDPPSFKNSRETMRGRLIDSEFIDFDLLKHWLRLCSLDRHIHKECCDSEAAYLTVSLKLVDCITRTIESAPEKCKYAAVSYVWGQQKNGIPESQLATSLPSQLPRTIEDAITVTKALGLRYLWIDRYCIPQSDVKERHNQIRKMDLIYSGAYFTIIAAAGQDPDFGLPGVSSTHRIPQCRVQIGNHTFCSLLKDPKDIIRGSTWMSRAWTFQEAIFSKRRLIFTEQQVYFECQTTNLTETLDLDYDRSEVNMFVIKPVVGDSWDICDLISKYSGRKVSYDEDILNAFRGVFRAHEAVKHAHEAVEHPVSHYWGVPILPSVAMDSDYEIIPVSRKWCQGFCIGLCWLTALPGKRRKIFPSWSWVGWSSVVKFCQEPYRCGLENHAELALDVSVELRNGETKSLWYIFRSHNSDALFSTYLHIKNWTIPLQLETATPDPTMVGALDYATMPDSGDEEYINLYICLYLAQTRDQDPDFDTNLQSHPPIGIILGDYRHPHELSPITFVLVAQQKESSYECIGHMTFEYNSSWRHPEPTHQWKLRVPNKAYPFRHKSIQKIRLG